MTYTLIIPIYNEERTLPTLLNKLYKLNNKDIEIIIIDDGSNDNTQNILSKNNLFVSLRNKLNKGKGASIKKGILSAKNQNIIIIDGDLEIDIEDIPKLIDIFEKSNNDVMTGVRWRKNSDFRFEINTIGNYLINSLFNLLYSTNLNDVLCCVKIINTNLIKSLDIQSEGFSIEIETMAKLVLNKLNIEEIDITYNRRTANEGKKLKISDGWGIIWTMIKIKIFG
tara:strand:- start:125 stop:799 length:675 start_codon:yes stop_codon:yes gene_type:complete